MITAIIQARMGSTRLPDKVLAEIEGKPLLLHIVERLGKSKRIEKIVIATSTNKKDDKVEAFAKKNDILCFRGSEDDILDRFYKTAKEFNADHIVRIWGDCVLIDPEIVDNVIEHYLDNNLDYCSNVRPPSFPRGTDVEVFSFDALHRTWKDAKEPFFREYMTDYIFRNPDLFKIGNVKYKKDISDLNWCVDYEEDLEFATDVIKHFKIKMFHMQDILNLIESSPGLAKNKDMERYTDYKEELEKRGLSLNNQETR